MLTLQLIGSWQLERGSRPIALRTQKARALLAYLALERRPQRRQSLAALLWPELDQRRALNNLASTLMHLRRSLSDSAPLIQDSEGDRLTLAADDLSIDVDRFTEAEAQLRRHDHVSIERCALCAAALDQLLARISGPLLPDLELDGCEDFSEWLLHRRESFHQRFTFWRVSAGRIALRRGDFERAISLFTAVLADEPWREEVLIQLARAYDALGQRITALRTLERGLNRLSAAEQIQPSPAARQLLDDLRAAVPLPSPTAVYLVPALPTVPFTRGLRTIVLDLIATQPQRLVSLIGPSGSGKTVLAIDLARQLHGTFTGGIVFVPVSDDWNQQALLFALGQRLGLPAVSAVPAIEQISTLLRRTGWLLLFDDGQRSPALGATVAALMDAVDDLTIIVTSHQPLGLQRETVITVGGLSLAADDGASESVRFLRARLQSLQPQQALPADEVLEPLAAALGGLPLALELAAHQLQRLAPAAVLETVTQRPLSLAAAVNDLPPRHRSLRAILDTTWAMVDGADRPLLAALTCFLTPFSPAAAGELVADRRSADAAFQRFTLLGLLSGTSHRHTLHPLIRDYVLQLDEAVSWIAAAQRRYSRFMLSQLTDPVLDRFDQQSQAAIERLAARLPDLQSAWRIACANGELQLLRDVTRRLPVFVDIVGWHQPAFELLMAAAAAADPSVQPEITGDFLVTAAVLQLLAGNHGEARRLVDQLEPIALPPSVRIDARLVRAVGFALAADLVSAADLLEELNAVPQLTMQQRCRISFHRARVAMMRGDLQTAADSAETAAAAAAASNELQYLIGSNAILAQLPARRGDWAAALPLLEANLAETRRIPTFSSLMQALANLAQARARTGRPAAEVLAPARELEELLTRSGLRPRLSFMLQSLATTYLLVSLDLQAERLLGEALHAVQHQSSADQLVVIKGFAHLAVNRNSHDEARRLLTLVISHPDTPPHVRATAAELRAGLLPADVAAPPELAAVLQSLLTQYPPA
jgi:DNA-binding SARP family transcriptional activator